MVASSAASTRSGAGRWPGRWSPRRSSSISTTCRRVSGRRSTNSKALTAERARGGVRRDPPLRAVSGSAPPASARSTASTSCAPGCWRCAGRWRRSAIRPGPGAGRRQPATAALPCPVQTVVRGDAQEPLGRRRLDRRQGDARPHHARPGGALSAAMAGSTNVGYATRRPPPRHPRARGDGPPPPLVRLGQAEPRRSAGSRRSIEDVAANRLIR